MMDLPAPRLSGEPADAAARLIRAHDWATTSLGPPRRWPVPLGTLVEVMLGSNQPMFLVWGPERTLLYNDAYAEILAGKHPGAMGRPFLEVWHEIRDDLVPIVEQAFRGEPVRMDDITLTMERRGYPEEAHFAFSYTPVRDEGGAIAGFFCACQEITGQVMAERRLRESEERAREEAGRVRLALDAGAIIGTWDWDLAADRFTADERFAGSFGLDPEECRRGLGIEQVVATVHPEDRPGLMEAIGAALVRGGAYAHQYRVRRADGRFYWIEANGRVDQGPDGTPLRFPGVLLDLESRRALAAERDRARRLLESFVEAVPGVAYAKDREGRMLVANRGTAELIGKPPEEYLGRTDAEFLGDPAEARAIMETDRRIMESGVAEQVEEVISLPDGSPSVWFSTKAPLRDGEGRVVGLIGSSIDITARKRAEAALAESEERFRFALDAAGGIGTWDWDIPADRIVASERFARIYGLDPERARAGLPVAEYMQGIHPDDRAEVERLIGEAVATGGDYRAEYRIRTPDGQTRWVIARGRCLLDGEGRPARLPGVTFDITDRKAAEEELRARTAELESLLVSAPLGVAFFDRGHRWVRINEELAAANGHPVEHHVGRRLEELLPGSAPSIGPVLDRVFATGEAVRDIEVTEGAAAEPGRSRHWLVNYYPVRDPGGAITTVGAWVVDITRRKEAEARANEESRVLETLNRAGTALAGELDLERLLQRLTDAAVELVGARFGAYFHNVTDEGGERFGLYTLSGAERSDFEGMGGVRATGIFAPTFLEQAVVRSEDVPADPRYGWLEPHRGMPSGHLPVRSYLGVPVASRSGEVLGGLLFGHPEPGRFTERHERLMVGLAAQAAIAIDNARLFREVQRANETLERRVEEAIAERERAEEALRQSQKMEAVGQLTGGIAHDFNNMLAAVVGSLDLLGRRIGDGDARARRYVDAAMEGARRAATLTQRLLAFSRQQPLRPEPVDANRLVTGMTDLLRRSLGAGVRLETALAEGLWRTHADPNQLESVILNLGVNARDAMPEGGRLTISTANVEVGPDAGAVPEDLPPGQYVEVAVTDTGTGMAPEVIARAFDPFFTTKPVGQGTGLGLSQVYGFVRQSGGQVGIRSEPGKGTTVRIRLPRLEAYEDEEAAPEPPRELPRGEPQEVVLVVEDEPVVRQFTVDALRELGYRVLEADGAAAALALLDAHPEVALLLTDIVMPETDGRRLADEALRRRPDLRVLFATGYPRNAVAQGGVLDPGTHLLGKPFTVEVLAAKLREVLEEPRRG